MRSRSARFFFCLSILLVLFFGSLAFGQVVFTYNNFTAPTANLQANGDAGSVGAVMRLTTTLPGQSGSVWYYGGTAANPTPVSLVNGFTTSFQFQITAPPPPPEGPPIPPADGIAFVIQNGSFPQNPGGGCPAQNGTIGIKALEAPDSGCGGDIGYTGLTNSVAIEFDDFQNAWDLDANHVAIQSCGADANSSNHNGNCFQARTTTQLHSIIGDGNPHTVVIKYSPPNCVAGANCKNPNNLQVYLDSTLVLTKTFDLGSLGLDDNQDAFVGFVGRTGALDANQDILNWSFSTTAPPSQTITQGSPTVTATFNNAENNLVQEVVDFSGAFGNGSITIIDGTQMNVANQAIVPSTWQPTWVPGTPFATSSCWPHNGEGNNCKLYIDLCTNSNSGTQLGANCPTSNPPSIIVTDNFSGPKIDPNTLGPNTGFGLLEAPDNWQGGPCVFTVPSSAAGEPCPQNVLTSLTGDPAPAGTVPHFNSTFVAIYGVAQPGTTIALNPAANGNGWINNSGVANPSVSATFTTSTQPPPSPNPNNYVQPDVAQLMYSFSNTNPPSVLIPSTVLPAPVPPSAVTSYTFPVQNLGSLQDGRYVLSYQGQDDHGTRELLFSLVNNNYSTAGKTLAVNIDTTKPTESVSLASSVYLNSPLSANYTCSDTLSGVATCRGQNYSPAVTTTPNVNVPLSTSSVGQQAFSVTATDAAGNASTTTVNYNITYQFFGFVPEVFFPGINKVKAGIVIPAGFLLTDGNLKPITNLRSISVSGFASTNCSGANPTPVAITGSLLNFGYGIYDYNWKTSPSFAGQCITFQANMGDGVIHALNFQFTK
jgi:Legume lectin domain